MGKLAEFAVADDGLDALATGCSAVLWFGSEVSSTHRAESSAGFIVSRDPHVRQVLVVEPDNTTSKT
jgi:hypothetical protein